MKTKHKMAIAKIAYRAVGVCRSLVGRGNHASVARRGIRFDLDLSEGIDLAIYLQGQFEPRIAAACARFVRPNQTVLDIGANIGAHTLNLARLVGERGTVFAFEPTTYAFAKLKRNLELNPELSRRVLAYQSFLCTEDGMAAPNTVYSSWPLAGKHKVHAQHLGAAMTTEGASARSLDRVLAERGNPPVHFVKMDVDGHESDVLAGAQKMMERDRPIFVTEIVPYVHSEYGRSIEDFLSYFLSLGYRFYRVGSLALLPSEPKLLASLVSDGASINVIARVD